MAVFGNLDKLSSLSRDLVCYPTAIEKGLQLQSKPTKRFPSIWLLRIRKMERLSIYGVLLDLAQKLPKKQMQVFGAVWLSGCGGAL
eukprot:6238066-Amphidinium_carterae.1